MAIAGKALLIAQEKERAGMFSDARLIFKKFPRIFWTGILASQVPLRCIWQNSPAPEIMTVRRINDDKWSKWPPGDLLGKQSERRIEFSRTAQVLWENDHEPSAQDTEGRQAPLANFQHTGSTVVPDKSFLYLLWRHFFLLPPVLPLGPPPTPRRGPWPGHWAPTTPTGHHESKLPPGYPLLTRISLFPIFHSNGHTISKYSPSDKGCA